MKINGDWSQPGEWWKWRLHDLSSAVTQIVGVEFVNGRWTTSLAPVVLK